MAFGARFVHSANVPPTGRRQGREAGPGIRSRRGNGRLELAVLKVRNRALSGRDGIGVHFNNWRGQCTLSEVFSCWGRCGPGALSETIMV